MRTATSRHGAPRPRRRSRNSCRPRSLRALRRGYARAILENLSFGLPVIQWRENLGVVAVPAEKLSPFARRLLEVNGEPLPEVEERRLLHQARSAGQS